MLVVEETNKILIGSRSGAEDETVLISLLRHDIKNQPYAKTDGSVQEALNACLSRQLEISMWLHF